MQQSAVAEVQTVLFPEYSQYQEQQATSVNEEQTAHSIESARSYDYLKRAFDVVGAVTLLTILSPIMLAIAAAIRFSSPGRIVFKQRRLTKGGQEFIMYKFRTMVTNAESMTGAVWANVRDVRITPFGRLLRATRLDELPQLVNVLRGEMSLIGPRPERPEMARDLARELPGFNRRMAVRAGLSGLAQVSSGYAACVDSYRVKLAHDLYYVENRSLLLDLKIALKTVSVVLTAFGSR